MGSESYCDSTIQYITDTYNPKFYTHTLSAFPNPASNSITFNLLGSLTRPASIEILSFEGKSILQKNISLHDQYISFDVSSLSSGIYLARMMDDRGVIGLEKFIVE